MQIVDLQAPDFAKSLVSTDTESELWRDESTWFSVDSALYAC